MSLRCSKTGIGQGDRTDEEMVDFINDYEYLAPDTYSTSASLSSSKTHEALFTLCTSFGAC